MLNQVVGKLGMLCTVWLVAGCTVSREEWSWPSAQVTWAVRPATLAVGDAASAQVGLQLTDAQGAPRVGTQLQLRASDGGQVLQPFGPTDVDGRTSAQVACLAPGAVVLSAVHEAGDGTVLLPGVGKLLCVLAADANVATPPNPNAPAQISVFAQDAVATADASAPTSITFLVTNSAGEPVVYQVVTLTASRPGDTVVPSTAVTDAQGYVVVTLTARTLGQSSVMVQAGNVQGTAFVQFVAGAPSISSSSWSARSQAPVVADGQVAQAFSLLVRDAAGHTVPYAAYSVASNGLGDVLQPSSGLTDAQGMATVGLTGTRAGLRTATATLHTGSLAASATLVPGPAAAAASSLVVDPPTQLADGATPTSLTAIINDVFGNPISGAVVYFNSTGSSNVLGSPVGVTSSTGVVSTSMTSVRAEKKLVSATTAGLSQSANVTFSPGSPNVFTSTLSIAPLTAVADGNHYISLSASVLDAHGNPLSGLPMTLSASNGDVTFSPASGTVTNSSGQMTSLASSTVTSPQVMTLSVGGLNAAANVIFVLGPPCVATSSFVASPNTGLASDDNASSTLVLTVRDSMSRPLPFTNVTYSLPSQESALSARVGLTDSSGMSSVTMTSASAGIHPAFAQTGALSLSASVDFATKALSSTHEVVLGGHATKILSPPANIITVSAADVDGDTFVDVIASQSSGGVAVFLGQGNNNFGPPTILSGSGTPQQVVMADFNADGRPEAIVASGGSFITIYSAAGAGGLTAGVQVPMTGAVSGVCVADFNADGNMDVIAVSNSGTVGFTVALGDGGLHFDTQTFYPSAGTPARCAAADFNIDGNADVAIIHNANSIVDIYYSRGGTLFSAQQTITLTAPLEDIKVGALNGDIYPDLVVVSGSAGTMASLLGAANGIFGSPSYFPIYYAPDEVELIDIDNDGKLDAAVTTAYRFIHPNTGSGPGAAVMLGNGDGTFQPQISVPVGGRITSLAVADFNKDGYNDIIMANSTPEAGIFYGKGPRSWSYRTELENESGLYGIIAADYDGDGNIDVINSYDGRPPFISYGNGDGNFTASFSMNGTNGLFPLKGDFDGDGKLDMAMQDRFSSATTTWSNQGNRIFTTTSFGDVGFAYINYSASVGDINADGIDDIILPQDSCNALEIRLGTSTKGVYVNSFQSTLLNSIRNSVVADIDGDGIKDIVGSGTDLTIWYGMGDGTFASPVSVVTTASHTTWGLAAVDVDGNGQVDLVVSVPNYTVWFQNQGGRVFFEAQRIATPLTESNWLSVGDFNGDGLIDVIAASDSLSLYLNRGSGILAEPLYYYVGNISAPFAVADLNHDGLADVTVPTGAFMPVVLLNYGPSAF